MFSTVLPLTYTVLSPAGDPGVLNYVTIDLHCVVTCRWSCCFKLCYHWPTLCCHLQVILLFSTVLPLTYTVVSPAGHPVVFNCVTIDLHCVVTCRSSCCFQLCYHWPTLWCHLQVILLFSTVLPLTYTVLSPAGHPVVFNCVTIDLHCGVTCRSSCCFQLCYHWPTLCCHLQVILLFSTVLPLTYTVLSPAGHPVVFNCVTIDLHCGVTCSSSCYFQLCYHWPTLCCHLQVILLSATMPVDVLDVTKRFMREPIRILVKKEELTLEGIRQFYIEVEREVSDHVTLVSGSMYRFI